MDGQRKVCFMYVTRKASEEIVHRVESNYLQIHNNKSMKG